MRRLLCLLPLAVVLVAPTGAPAKEVSSLTLCGRVGCHGVKGDRAKRGFERDAIQTRAPRRAEPFFELRVGIRAHEGERIPGFSLRYLPVAGLLRSQDERGNAVWTRPAPALASALERAARGLEPKPAALLGSLRGAPPARVRVVEVVQPPASDSGGTGGPPWLLVAAGAGVLALGLAGLAMRRGRRGRATRPAAG
jgi:hypothetical protein